MKRSLVAVLRDPISGKPLQLSRAEGSHAEGASADEEGEVLSGVLSSPGFEYEIKAGVPVLVRPDHFAQGQQETVETFSWKWDKAKSYRTATLGHYRQWYLDRYGFRSEAALAEFLRSKTTILDAGTAHGRDAEMYHTNSTAQIYGVDISSGIRNAYQDLRRLERLNLIQADLTKLPFPDEFFDFIGCDQVIHHTPNTRQSLTALLRKLAVGGHVAFYVYKKKGPVREFCDDHIRKQTVGMTPEQCLEVSEAITKFGKALSDLKLEIEVPADIPVLEIKAGKYDLQRFIYWNMFKCYWNDTMDMESNVITNFDWYHPLHAHRHTPEEVKQWCAEENLQIEHFDVQEAGVSVLGKKTK